MPTATVKGVSFIIRDCDPSLWKKFKAKTKAKGHTLRWVLLDMIRRYVEER